MVWVTLASHGASRDLGHLLCGMKGMGWNVGQVSPSLLKYRWFDTTSDTGLEWAENLHF